MTTPRADPDPAGSGGRLTVAMYVYNDATMDSRVRREAATLAAAGHAVTVLATNRPGVAELERERVEGFEIVRIPVPDRWHRHWLAIRRPGVGRGEALAAAGRAVARGPAAWPTALRNAGAAAGWLAVSLVRRIALLVPPRLGGPGEWPPAQAYYLAKWRWSTLPWGDAAVAAAPPADVHHGHDLTALPAAVRGARRDGGQVVYDSHEIFVESGRNAERPRWAKALLRRLERRWGDRLAALVAVNPEQGREIARRVRAARVVTVHNCPPTWRARGDGRLRAMVGAPDGVPLILYHGAFSPLRGLEELAEALLRPALATAHLAYLGFGGHRAALDAIATDARFGGRVHVLDAVPPDELLAMIAGADLDVMPLQRSTLNHWLASPNKLFESIAAGVPVVVSDFPVMRRIVLDDPSGPLGAVCDPADPASIAAAIASLLASPAESRERMRERCRTAALERWNWETESRALLDLYADLSPPRA
ncbi:MAG TPA: glycosyltransferase [Candidatus Limnocylindrales bacterium]|nr:glycosyltransferase [Candidatus Limnocylindrales bacterium]